MPRKLTYDEVKNKLEEKGFEILSKEYINNSTKIKVKCLNNHITFSTFQSIMSSKNGCTECAGNKKYGIEDVKRYFEENGCVLLEKNYTNANTRMKYVCECGRESKISFSKFKNGQRCIECGNEKCAEKQKLDFDYIRQFFYDQDCILLSEKYVRNSDNLEFICKCGEKSTTTWATFKTSKSCSKCGYEKTAQKLRKYDTDFIKEYLNEYGYDLLDEFKDSNSLMKCICPNGHETHICFKHFRVGVRCKECYIENNKGENHPSWNPNKTDEERQIERKYYDYNKWRSRVYQRDDFTCQCCGNRNVRLNAHHLNGYHWAIDQRTDVNNGITLCEDCHDDFHNIYGRNNNTREQFEEYMGRYYLEL